MLFSFNNDANLNDEIKLNRKEFFSEGGGCGFSKTYVSASMNMQQFKSFSFNSINVIFIY